MEAAGLRPGDQLYTNDSRKITVANVVSFLGSRAMYNLTVDTIHTYYVIVGTAPVLVHNACSTTSGNTPAAMSGMEIHGRFSDFLNDVGSGYSGRRTLPSGKRIDGAYLDPATGREVPVELKPNNADQIRKGWKQLEEYETDMGTPAGSGQLWVYDVGPDGALYFTRVL
jgi:Restriction endonuclease fold toxin 9/Pretoxin HINT domain